MSARKLTKLRDKLNDALRSGKVSKALELYDALAELEPEEPRWPHRRGDLLRRENDVQGAVQSFEQAVDAYAAMGFVARAAALAKLVISLDPSRVSVLERVDPEAARRLHREARASAAERAPIEKSAPVLLADLSAPDDEIRFLDADDEESVELDLSELELADAPLELDAVDIEILDIPERPRRTASADLSLLPSTPLFAEVPPAALRGLLAGAELVECAADDTLLHAGSAADSLYILCEGNVEVRVPGLPGIRLGEGEVLGESCLLDHVERRADVVALDAVTALRIKKEILDTLVANHAEMGDVLLELLTRRLIANVVRTAPIFASFDKSTRKQLANLFEVRRADEGTVLCQEGKKSDGFYAVLIGTVQLSGASQAELHAGQLFGQRSLIDHAPSAIGARAETDLLLLRLPRSRFSSLAATFPPVLAYLAELSTGESSSDAFGAH